jgi:hypothetical protein
VDKSAQLLFQQLPPEAQRAALWRLVLSGLTAEQVAERTGVSIEQVRSSVQPPPMQHHTLWRTRPRDVSAIRSAP